jgi:plasmid stabilization system protein ParE
MKVIFSRRALAQLAKILAYTANESPQAAASMATRVYSLVGLLAEQPGLGRSTEIARVRAFRIAPYPYLLFYLADSERERLTVLRIRHTARKENWQTAR